MRHVFTIMIRGSGNSYFEFSLLFKFSVQFCNDPILFFPN